jgi:predicted nucleic acid-binding protein
LTSNAGHGLMLVVDASCLYELVVGSPGSQPIRDRLSAEPDWAAPHVVDVEVFGVIRQDYLRGRLDRTAAAMAVADLESWPGERYGHRLLLQRAWELRETVRGWDAMYVALAEALDAVLLTTDRRLAAATGPTCRIEVAGE